MAVSGRIRFALLIAAVLCPAPAAAAQEPAELAPLAAYGTLLDPLMTEGERRAWDAIGDDASRADFVRAFWAERDPTPGTPGNERRDIFERRVRRAIQELAEGATPGYATDRGRVMLVYGLPDEQELRAVPPSAAPTLTWDYRRHTPSVRVRFTREGETFLLDEEPELSNAAFMRSLGDDLRLQLATAVGDRHGALERSAEPSTSAVDPADAGVAPLPPEVAPEVKIWLEMVYSGAGRDELELRHRLHFFPASDGTYAVLTFEVDKASLEFFLPAAAPVVEGTAGVEGDAGEGGDAVAAVAPPLTAAEAAAEAGMGPAADEEPEPARADLRVFGAFLQGEPGQENTLHSFIIPYQLMESAGDGDSSPSLSLGVTLFPGTYRLAWGVLDATTGRAVTRDETIQIPDYTQGDLSLTRPVLAAEEIRDDPRPMNTTTIYQGIRLGGVLVANDIDDVFGRDDTVEVVAVVTGWASDPAAPGKPRLEVVYRILEGLEGEKSLARLPDQVLDFHVLGQQIPLGQVKRLRPGHSYRIEVRVKDLVGGGETVQRTPIHLRAAVVTDPEESVQ